MLHSLFRGDLPARLRASTVATAVSCLIVLASAFAIEGMLLWDEALPRIGLQAATALAILASGYHHFLRLAQAIRKFRYVRSMLPDLALIALTIAVFQAPEPLALFASIRALYVLAVLGRSTGWGRRALEGLFRNPAKVTLLSFLAVIALGTLLLSLPRATTDMQGAPLEDALFTATSAACVTGLVVANTADDEAADPSLPTFSLFGQIVILLLIQFGGLGIMTVSATGAALMAGGRISLRESSALARVLGEDSPMSAAGMLRGIVAMTLAFELAGAAFLSLRFLSHFPGDSGTAVWFGVFHAVSAFCNAGFSLFGRNLVDFRTDPVVNLTIGGLIIAGGLGFSVIAALAARRTWRTGPRGAFHHLPIHARMVLVVTATLTVVGALGILWLDADGSLQGLPLSDRLWAAGFQSVSARTAGFNTVDLSAASRSAVLLYLFLMFVGASPGGTGGGIKTTTFALLLLSVRATLRGRSDVEFGGRTIDSRTMMKVSVVTLTSFAACFVVCLILLALHPELSTEQLMFETVSAFGTAGLSMGTTPLLGLPGKLLITFLMYLGRIGPLTLTLAIGQQQFGTTVRYPEGRVMVG